MRRKLFVAAILLLPLISNASECERFNVSKEDLKNASSIENIPNNVLVHYQQPGLIYKDVVGDFSLMRKALTTRKRIFWILTKDNEKIEEFTKYNSSGYGCAKEVFPAVYNERIQGVNPIPYQPREVDIAQVLNSKLSQEEKENLLEKLNSESIYIEGKKNPIIVKKFVHMIGQIMNEEVANGIVPKVGTPHVWSDEVKKSRIGIGTEAKIFSKLLWALGRGETSQYLVTGKEKELEEWIISQELHSIEHHHMIRESYRINDGDMYLTLLTIENVLSRFWRHSQRKDLPITQRLKPFINTFGSNGDLFGSWYHFYGIMLYGYVVGEVKAKIVGTTETIGSQVLSNFAKEMQENYINYHGGAVGARLKKSITNLRYREIGDDPKRLSSVYYLNLDEVFIKDPSKKELVKPMGWDY